MFGEVYPDPVRVVKVGEDCSVEFCGGTHIANTADAEAFVLTEETAVAKGVRRITAITRKAAKKAVEEGEFVLHACIVVFYFIILCTSNNADNHSPHFVHASCRNQIYR